MCKSENGQGVSRTVISKFTDGVGIPLEEVERIAQFVRATITPYVRIRQTHKRLMIGFRRHQDLSKQEIDLPEQK